MKKYYNRALSAENNFLKTFRPSVRSSSGLIFLYVNHPVINLDSMELPDLSFSLKITCLDGGYWTHSHEFKKYISKKTI